MLENKTTLVNEQAKLQARITEQQKSILYGFALGLAAGDTFPSVDAQLKGEPRKEEAH